MESGRPSSPNPHGMTVVTVMTVLPPHTQVAADGRPMTPQEQRDLVVAAFGIFEDDVDFVVGHA